MSPILKRDITEQLRQAKRLAQATTGLTFHDYSDHPSASSSSFGHELSTTADPTASSSASAYTSGSSARQGIGVDKVEVDFALPAWKGNTTAATARPTPFGNGNNHGHAQAVPSWKTNSNSDSRMYDEARSYELDYDNYDEEEPPEDEEGTQVSRDIFQNKAGRKSNRGWSSLDTRTDDVGYSWEEDNDESISRGRGRNSRSGREGIGLSMGFSEAEDADEADGHLMAGRGGLGKWRDLRSLLFEATPSLLLALVGLVFTGELLEHLARWRVFRRVDELFILVPMIGNLKGNLEMCLSARLGTSANIGELDHRKTRRAMLLANMTLLGLQALLISSLAAVISFVLGLFTIHRLGDQPNSNSGMSANATLPIPIGPEEPLDPGLAMAGEEWHEGYTRPGWKQLVMVLATGMGAAGISSAVLGSFMGSLIVVSRWFGADPDNITPPLAACLGDLLTLFILALLGTALVGAMDTVIPLLAVIVMSVAAGWFTRRVMRNEWVKNVAKGGWVPLIGAMLISSGTGMVLAKGVGKYRGFALLAISMTGLTGSMGAIHANRLSTSLHTLLHPRPDPLSALPQSGSSLGGLGSGHGHGLSPFHGGLTLFVIGFPCQAAFLLFVSWAGWTDLSLGWTGWACFAVTAALSITMAHWMTMYFWSKDLDPE
ncbi:solute carrier family 41 [Kwoniella heveanensis BCC8398]|uniref:Solute carrier family 41 n=1 Tax=Kwoniella heveanensis BCC8398 TaxID=1296120 RepID=A0A1B9GNB3_9TREE|nr:solute carrier family 41 [Kwoniella heveanensis BCC8398]